MSLHAIGGTDLAAICAFYRPQFAAEWAKWQTAADVWMRICHGVTRKQTKGMTRGLMAEPRLRRTFLDAYGGEMEPRPQKWILSHPRLPFVSVSPDDVWRITSLGGTFAREYVDWKTTSVFAMHLWGTKLCASHDDFDGAGAPDPYGLQVQLNLDVLDLPVGYLFVGFGKDWKDESGVPQFLYSETRRYRFERDRELVAMALADAERFHNDFIATRKPPPCEPLENKRAWKRLLKGEAWIPEAETAQS